MTCIPGSMIVRFSDTFMTVGRDLALFRLSKQDVDQQECTSVYRSTITVIVESPEFQLHDNAFLVSYSRPSLVMRDGWMENSPDGLQLPMGGFSSEILLFPDDTIHEGRRAEIIVHGAQK